MKSANTQRGRREFLRSGGGVLTACSLASLDPSSATAAGRGGRRGTDPVSGFGWELTNVQNNSASVYFSVNNTIVLNTLDVDLALMVTYVTGGAGALEALCVGGASRGGPPSLSGGGGVNFNASGDFGGVQTYNPNGIYIQYNGVLLQDEIFSVPLKTWVPYDGTASATYRHVTTQPGLQLNAGDYLAFSMGGGGVQSFDVEMQVVFSYTVI